MTKPFLLSLILLLSACANQSLPVDTIKKQLNIPDNWTELPEKTVSEGLIKSWWETINDPQLEQFITSALKNNFNVTEAELEITGKMIELELEPVRNGVRVNSGLSVSFLKKLYESDSTNRNYSQSTSLSYEVDLWGKISTLEQQKEKELEATIFDLEAIKLQLIWEVTKTYLDIQLLYKSLYILKNQIERLKEILSIQETNLSLGIADAFVVEETKKQLRTANSTVLKLNKDIKLNKQKLAFLVTGNGTNEISIHNTELLDKLEFPMVLSAIPAAMIARRPDIKAAEARLEAVFLEIDVARYYYYPTLNISTSLTTGRNTGGVKNSLSDTLKDPVGNLLLGLALPFLQFNEVDKLIKSVETRYALAAEQFKKKVYTTLLEVEQILITRNLNRHQYAILTTNFLAERKILQKRRKNYQLGLIPYTSYLLAKSSFEEVKLNLWEKYIQCLNDDVMFYLSVGAFDLRQSHLNKN